MNKENHHPSSDAPRQLQAHQHSAMHSKQKNSGGKQTQQQQQAMQQPLRQIQANINAAVAINTAALIPSPPPPAIMQQPLSSPPLIPSVASTLLSSSSPSISHPVFSQLQLKLEDLDKKYIQHKQSQTRANRQQREERKGF